MQRINYKLILLILLFVTVSLYEINSLVKIITTFAPDFSVFYQSAVNLTHGKNVYTDQTLYTGFGYPPFSALLFIPFTFMPYQLAQGLWIVGNAILLGICVYVSISLFFGSSSKQFFLIYSLAWISFPTKFTFGMGQVNIVALLLLLMALRNEGGLAGGILWGMLLILKPHFVLFLPILAIKKKWKTVGISLSIVFLAALIAGLFFGWGQYATYFSRTVPELLVFHGREIYYNQGLGAFFSRIHPVGLASAETTSISIGLLTGSYWIIYKKQIPLLPAIIMFVPIFLLVEPLSWQHHFVFLLPVYVYLLHECRGNVGKLGALVVSYLLVSANIKHPEVFLNRPMAPFILSHVFWGTILVFMLLVAVEYRKRSRPS